MLTRFANWDDFDRAFFQLDDLRQHLLNGHSEGRAKGWGWPRAELVDEGEELALYADLPGVADKDLALTLNHETLTIKGSRKVTAPEGYTSHRTERSSFEFARSFALPVKIDPEKAVAALKDGVLTVRMRKAEESQMRRITVTQS